MSTLSHRREPNEISMDKNIQTPNKSVNKK